MTLAEGIRKLGFRCWYERQLIVLSGGVEVGADADPALWLKVRCRKCAHQRTIE